MALVDAIAAGETGEGLRVINAVVDGGADVRQFATQIVEYLRALLHTAAATGRGGQGAVTELTVAPEHVQAFTLGEIASLVKRFTSAEASCALRGSAGAAPPRGDASVTSAPASENT